MMSEMTEGKHIKYGLALLMLSAVVVAAFLAALTRSEPENGPVDSTTGPTPVVGAGVFEPLDAEREIFLHCGNSMRPAAEEIAAEFQKRHGIGVRLNFGGSSELLAGIELGKAGDLYLPHDPYAGLLEEKGLLDYYEVTGYLEPVIIVPAGNPKGIRGMRDLAADDMDIAIPDRRYATAGRMVTDAFERLGLLEEMEANIRMEGRSHSHTAQALLWGHVDAAVVWNFIAVFYQGRLEAVFPDDVDFPEVRVTLCLLKNARDRAAAEKFIELAVSEFGRRVFEKHGYR